VREKTNKPDQAHNRHLRNKYNGLTVTEYREQIKLQDNRCAICLLKNPKGPKNRIRFLDVDHCHITGINRGILCFNCNQLLERAQDSITILENAIFYLKSHTKDFRVGLGKEL
jgi:hypothetical protein